MTVEVIEGDALQVLATLPAELVHCVVTSPPYWGLRKYEGVEPTIWECGLRSADLNGDGKAACEHDWGNEEPGDPRGGSGPDAKECYGGQDGETNYARRVARGQFCQRCGAWRGCLGLEPTPELYVEHVVQVFRAVRRVLRKDGTLWLNLGDSHASSAGPRSYGSSDGFVRRAGAVGSRIKATGNVKPKDLVGIPWRVAFALQADGWWLRSAIVWAKGLSFCASYSGSVMPESCRDRPTSAYEMVFLLSRSARYFYDWFAARESDQGRPSGNKCQKIRGEHGGLPSCHKGFGVPWQPDGSGRNWRNVWVINPQSYPGAHFATFPEGLVERCITAGSSPKTCAHCGAPWARIVTAEDTEAAEAHRRACGADKDGEYHGRATKDYAAAGAENASDVKRRILAGMKTRRTVAWQPTCSCIPPDDTGRSVVLDPFVGSGTTLLAAKRLGRDGIGIEASPQYCDMARRRSGAAVTEPLFV